MSTAHRPTWDPAQAKEVKGGSRQYSSRDMAAHTKLKFRQPGQTSTSEVAKRDLRAELLAAEQEARDRKRKAEGLPVESMAVIENGDDEGNKRRKLLQEAVDLDKDDDDEGENDAGDRTEKDDQDDSEEDSDEEEDDTAELLRELEKIKRERAEEKARQEREQSVSESIAREAEIATSNPLLNLQAALGQTPGGSSTSSSFTVKRRWDDDLIFKNQASTEGKPTHFVNDLLRTEFHKKFMAKFIKVCSCPFMNLQHDAYTLYSNDGTEACT
ncbi:Pre-mRNA-splicing factor Cwf15/Cwc15 [Hysterangium stoloniferum]|nr:Pre-mRNA-splicing factor Cwf15/Cwc15 [Hysterangium stoloniferum]